MEGADRAGDETVLARVALVVSGLVQGVWFRQSTCTRARALGLTGSVRNLPDGRVEVVAEGPRADVEALVAYCHAGPPAARVRGVELRWVEPEGALGPFEVHR